MRYTQIGNTDLNLLVALQAFIEERSIKRAAQRLFLSQSATSRVLDRLQLMFNDELLVRTAQGYEPTERALSAYTELCQLLPKIDNLIIGSQFEPALAAGIFRAEVTDWDAAVLLPEFLEIVAKQAPGVQVEVFPKRIGLARLESNEVDLVLTAQDALRAWTGKVGQDFQVEFLLRYKHVCVVRTGHPLTKGRLTLRRYLASQHLAFSPMQGASRLPAASTERQASVRTALERLNLRRDVRFTVPYVMAMGPIVERTDLIATISLAAARRMKTRKLRIIPAPIEFQSSDYVQVWHLRTDASPLHKWLRSVMSSVAARLNRRLERL